MLVVAFYFKLDERISLKNVTKIKQFFFKKINS